MPPNPTTFFPIITIGAGSTQDRATKLEKAINQLSNAFNGRTLTNMTIKGSLTVTGTMTSTDAVITGTINLAVSATLAPADSTLRWLEGANLRAWQWVYDDGVATNSKIAGWTIKKADNTGLAGFSFYIYNVAGAQIGGLNILSTAGGVAQVQAYGAFYPGTVAGVQASRSIYDNGSNIVVDSVVVATHTHTGGAGGTVAHASLGSVTADQHHAESHTHASHTSIGANDHHNQAHTTAGADHSDWPAGLDVTELGYVNGVTSAIQGQIDLKAPLASPTFTGTVTLPAAGNITGGTLTLSGGADYGAIKLVSTAAGAVTYTAYRNEAGTADDIVARFQGNFNDSGGTERLLAYIDFVVTTPTAGAVDSRITFNHYVGGAVNSNIVIKAGDIYKGATAYSNPDYVFDWWADGRCKEPYQGLLTLPELDAYLKEHRHLPGISREASGIFDRADIVLEKVEEVSLYVLQLHERISALEAQLATHRERMN